VNLEEKEILTNVKAANPSRKWRANKPRNWVRRHKRAIPRSELKSKN
jgi:hypothetical protein